MALTNRFVRLSSGLNMPLLGLGTFQMKDPKKLRLAITTAIQTGYRLIDTAFSYGNEQLIGETLTSVFESGLVKRDDLFITTKMFSSFHRRHRVIDALKMQLKSLQLDYVDLYLIHFPVPFYYDIGSGELLSVDRSGNVLADPDVKLEDTWQGMEDCVAAGMVRSIGVSNFTQYQVSRLLNHDKAVVKPAVNQIELHPAFQNGRVASFCQEHGVAVTAYSPFGSPGTLCPKTKRPLSETSLLENCCLVKIGQKYGKTPAQVILRWLVQKNIAAVPKSETPSRIVENYNIWDFQLSDEDLTEIAKLDTNKRIMTSTAPGIDDHPEFPFNDDSYSQQYESC